MSESIGKKLSQTRIQRGLSLDEAAHATKLRPDKILALEACDYASFPSNSYARGFLLIYGRFLKVDVSEDAAALDTVNRLSVEDYQYLSNANEPRPEPKNYLPDLSRRKKPSLVPLFAFFGAIIVLFFGFTAYVNWQRIRGEVSSKEKAAQTAIVETQPEPLPEPVRDPVPAPETPVAVAPETPPVEEAAAPPEPIAMPPKPGVSDREFIGASPALLAEMASNVPAGEVTPPVPNPDRDLITATPVQMNEVEIAVAKTTWVKIRKDDPSSKPIFEDYLYPHTRGLKLKGTRFFIEARDSGSVEIRKNGDPIAYQSPGVTIQ